jgi:hypothetical protein
MPTWGVEPWENHQFPQGGMLKFTYKSRFLTLRIAYEKFLDWKCSDASSTHINFYFWKTLKSQFLVVFRSFGYGQILAVLGSFGQKLLHWQWLRACPKQGWNLQNPITLKPWIQMLHGASHWKATIHTYSLKKFQKLQQLHVLTVAYPKVQKAILAASGL